MPTYDYRCTDCGHTFEEFQSMSSELLRTCPSCGKPALKRLMGGGAGMIFKGSGFYLTDYKGNTEGNNKKPSEKKPSDKKQSESKPSGDTASESKSTESTSDKGGTAAESKGNKESDSTDSSKKPGSP
ncbi:MAG: zinc ribbon domain-containing protein [Ignavibacteriales bacterium]|nr:zinc ribbon domain-containing protein [Ignavibacteriales bacterium]